MADKHDHKEIKDLQKRLDDLEYVLSELIGAAKYKKEHERLMTERGK